MTYDSVKITTEFGEFVVENVSIQYLDPSVPFEVTCERNYTNMQQLFDAGLTYYSKDNVFSFLIEWTQLVNCLR